MNKHKKLYSHWDNCPICKEFKNMKYKNGLCDDCTQKEIDSLNSNNEELKGGLQ